MRGNTVQTLKHVQTHVLPGLPTSSSGDTLGVSLSLSSTELST